jgi:hypothetical protein
VRRGRNLGEQPRLDVLSGAQQVDGRSGRSRDSVLALDEEEAELVAPRPVMEPADRTSDAVPRAAGRAKSPAATVG